MSPEEKARLAIDQKLVQSGWVIQDMKQLNLSAGLGVAVRKFPTSTGEVDYEKLKAKGITKDRLWDCYAIKQPEKVKQGTMVQLADLISLIRFEMGAAEALVPFVERVNYNFQQ